MLDTFILSPFYQLPDVKDHVSFEDIEEAHPEEIHGLATGTSFLLYQTTKDRLYIINPTIHYFLSLFNTERTPRDIIQQVAQEGKCRPADIAPTVNEFAESMLKRKILIPSSKLAEILAFKEQVDNRDRLFSIGQNVHGYTIKQELAIRGNLELYIADRPNELGECVLKALYLPEDLPEKKKSKARRSFYQEFQFMRELDGNSRICTLFEIIEDASLPMAAMERIYGTSIRGWLKDGDTVPCIEEKNQVLEQITEAIGFAQEKGIFHGDIHSGNFLVHQGNVKLIDFDLANREAPRENEILRKGGVYEYIAPECLRTSSFGWLKKSADRRSEVYQLGIIIYYVLYGRFPFRAITWAGLADKILHTPPEFPDKDNSGNVVPTRLISICRKCLYKNPAKRYSSAVTLHRQMVRYRNTIYSLKNGKQMIDQQLRSNDCGISALKTVCNILDVDIGREIIESAIPLDQYGSSIGKLRTFLLDYGFQANFKLLDLNSVDENKELIQSWLPCITPVKRKDLLHYIVISDISDNRLVVMDPAKMRPYKISIQQFKKEAYYSTTALDFVDVEEKLRVKVGEELKANDITIDYGMTGIELTEVFNKLTYFGYFKDNFGFADEEASKRFLNDLIFNQEIKHIPEHFRNTKFKKEQVRIKTPLLLSVKRTEDTRALSLDTESKYVYWRLFQSISSMRELWYIFLGTALVASFIGYISVFINQILIDHVLPAYNMHTLGLFIIGVGIFRLVDIVIYIYKKYVSIHLSNSLDKYFLGVFDQKLSQYSIQYIQGFKRGDLTERLSDSLRLKSFFTRYFSSIIVNLLVATVSLFFLFMINWKLSFLVLGVLVLFIILFRVITPIIEQIERQRFQKKANYFSTFIEKIDGLQSIKALGLEKYSSAKIKKGIDELIQVNTKSKYVGMANGIATSLITSFAGLALLYMTSKEMIVDNSISLGMIITFLALSGKIFGAFSSLLNRNLSIQENKVILSRFFDFDEDKLKASRLAAEQAIESSNDKGVAVITPKRPIQSFQQIQEFEFESWTLKKVGFAYHSDNMIVDEVDLVIRKGEKIWIKGSNGSGKSTLCKVMGLLYEPTKGELLLNGVESSLFPKEKLRKKIIFISGDDILFNETLLFNITFGRKVDMGLLIEFAKVINFYSFISSKTDKFNFTIHENGRNLSTGQRKKVLLLRALMMDTELIILDEIFNGMDQDSKDSAETLLSLLDDRTFVIVSHMPINKIDFDQKLMIYDGRLLVQDSEYI